VDGGTVRQARFEGRVIRSSNGPFGAGFFLLPELDSLRPLTGSGTVTLQRPPHP